MEGIRRCVRVVVVIVVGGHKVGDGDYTGGCGVSGLENVGVAEVLLPGVKTGAGRTNPEMPAGLRVEDGSEDAGRVEARKAAPVYGAVGPDKRR